MAQINKKTLLGLGTKSFMDVTSCAVLLKEIELFEQNQYRERRRQIATWYNNNLPYKSIPEKIIFGKGIQCLFLQNKSRRVTVVFIPYVASGQSSKQYQYISFLQN